MLYRSSLLCAASLYFIYCVSRRVETDDDNVVDEADEEEIEDGGGREEEGEEDEEFPTTTISSSSSSTTLATTTKVAPPLLSSGCSAEERAECEQICSQSVDSLSNTSSVTCSCYRGFRLDADAKSCIGTLDHLIKCFVWIKCHLLIESCCNF